MVHNLKTDVIIDQRELLPGASEHELAHKRKQNMKEQKQSIQ